MKNIRQRKEISNSSFIDYIANRFIDLSKIYPSEDCDAVVKAANEELHQMSSVRNWKSKVISATIIPCEQHLLLSLEFENPLPTSYYIRQAKRNNIIILQNSTIGGAWIIKRVSSDRKTVFCKIPSKFTEQNENSLQISNLRYNWEAQCGDYQGKNMKIVEKQATDGYGYAVFTTPLHLQARAIIKSITSIDTVAQTFKADVTAELTAKSLSACDEEVYVRDFMSILNVARDIAFTNVDTVDFQERWETFYPADEGRSDDFHFSFKVRVCATFTTKMDLNDFPFDQQRLRVMLTVFTPLPAVLIMPNIDNRSRFQYDNFQLDAIFTLMFDSFVSCETKMTSTSYRYNEAVFRVYIERKSGYFVYNVVIPLTALALCCTLSFARNEDGTKLDTGSRLSITLTLLLTAVAYKFVIAGSLPQISYNTSLDWYCWYCFLFIVVNCMEIVSVASLVSSGHTSLSSREGRIFYALFTLFIVGFLLFVFFMNVRRRISAIIAGMKREQEETQGFLTVPLVQRMSEAMLLRIEQEKDSNNKVKESKADDGDDDGSGGDEVVKLNEDSYLH